MQIFEVPPSKILNKLGDALFLELAHSDSFTCQIKDSSLWLKALTGATGLPPAATIAIERDLHDDEHSI
jgi:hypothetical protein